MEVAETSNPSFRRVLVFCFLLVLLFRCSNQNIKDSRFKITCQEFYVRNKLSSLSCEADKSFFDQMCDEKRQDLQFLYERADLDEDDGPHRICPLLFDLSKCQSEAAEENVLCEQIGDKWIYTCYFNASDRYLNVTTWCDINCESHTAGLEHVLIETTKCHPLVYVNETLTTAPPPAKPLPPKEEFPLWAAILIALGIAGLIALVAFLVWRKRRQAQGPVQDTEGGAAQGEGGGEGEGEGEGEDEGEGEEAEEAGAEESQQPEDAAEGGGEAPAEE